jgi:hypothetical protein
MKVLVCGSRVWPFPDQIEEKILELQSKHKDLVVLQGKARGADQIAEEICLIHNIPCQSFPADWQRYGKSAGFIRNVQMLDEKPDLVLAFRWANSVGTSHTLREAHKRNIPVTLIEDGPQDEA